jgi:hypothetical protein
MAQTSSDSSRALDAFLTYLTSSSSSDLEPVRTSLAALGEAAYDVVWLAGLYSDSPECRQAYSTAVQTLCASGILKQTLCIEQLDEEVLSACHLIESKDLFEKRVRRVRTKVL